MSRAVRGATYSFNGHQPKTAGSDFWIAPNAAVIGMLRMPRHKCGTHQQKAKPRPHFRHIDKARHSSQFFGTELLHESSGPCEGTAPVTTLTHGAKGPVLENGLLQPKRHVQCRKLILSCGPLLQPG